MIFNHSQGLCNDSLVSSLIIRFLGSIDLTSQCVLADKEVMLVVEPGTHGSTYGGNPLGCAVSLRALELIEQEDMTAKAEKLGKLFREGVQAFNSPIVELVRGKGLLNAVVINESAANGRSAWDLCILLKEKGLLVSSSPISADILDLGWIPPSLSVFTASHKVSRHHRAVHEARRRIRQQSRWILTRHRRNRRMGTSSDSLLR